MRVLEKGPSAACIRPEPAPAGTTNASAGTQNDPGQDLYAERSSRLAGLFMPPALPWEDLPEQDRMRWRGYAGARG